MTIVRVPPEIWAMIVALADRRAARLEAGK